jgi:chromosomal replication initiator protein
LARALGEAWNASQPDRAAYEFAAADIRKQKSVKAILATPESGKTSHAPASMFVIENLEQLVKQSSAQHRLRLLIDAAQLHGSRIVITSRVSPVSLDGLSAALRSRLCGGLIVSLAHPSFATRSAIVTAYADAVGLKLSPRAIGRIARQDNRTTAQILHSIATLQQNIAAGPAEVQVIEDSLVEEYLENNETSRPIQVSEIAAAVAKHFHLKISDLKGRSRRSGIAHTRCLAMYLTWQQGDYSLKRIGEYFGRRDHSTVLHACRKIEQLVRHDATTRQSIAEIKARLSSTAQF